MDDEEFHKELKKRYDEGESIYDLAAAYNYSYTGMRYRLLKAGTTLRANNGKVKPRAKT